MKELTAEIFGKVQGVGFRAYLKRVADELEVAGYARNDKEGHLEVLAQGSKEALSLFEERLRKGPHFADISDIDIEWHDIPQDTLTEFEIH